jgi:hypothetical protein
VLPIIVAALLLAPDPAVTASVPNMHVRPTSDIVRSILDEARRRSPTIQQLMVDLQELDTIVFVDLGLNPLADHGTTSIMTVAGSWRMLRVVINARLDSGRRIEILGHELFHALEIARAPSVRDGASFKAFYERIGYAISPTSFETDGAREVELRVRADMAARPGGKPAPRRPPAA